ncbi:MAG: tRNA guanosine(15) transglycosylase TgtA [Candidatus Thorarchaeota archaeon]|nr:tRNA guanosine(15) transglycosylase TgtA [Candidatus Thorarchaeota archaeon]
MDQFEVKACDGLARLGRLSTGHGAVTTPLIMPVVHPGKTAISPKELRHQYGFEMVITNSYIIKSRAEFRERALSEGVHALLDFDGPIMTDSGTFQMYFHALPENEIDHLEIVRFQRAIGSDIGTILDVFSALDVGRQKVEEDVRVSLERAAASVHEKGEMMLAGTVQGGVFPDLRERSAIEMAKLDFEVHPVGGVVPMMEQYRYADVVRATLAAKRHLPLNRPVHLFGCGHPMFLPFATLLGCDLFDSASYAKFAQDGRMMLPDGSVHLKDLRELTCPCPVCSSTSVQELSTMEKPERDLALMRHNLYVTAAEMRTVRQAISEGRLLELASKRARAHPRLLEALHVLLDHGEQIEREDPVGTGVSVFYTGCETAKHPVFERFHSRIIERYPYVKTKTVVLVPHLGDRPFHESAPDVLKLVLGVAPEDVLLHFVTPIGVVPWELGQVHPAQQSVFPETIDHETISVAAHRVRRLIDKTEYDRIIWLSRRTPTDSVRDVLDKTHVHSVDSVSEAASLIPDHTHDPAPWETRLLKAVFAYQWSLDLNRLHPENFRISVSRSTGKIRQIHSEEGVLFTLVPNTGLLTPTFLGGSAMLKAGLDRRYIVAVEDDAVEFVAEGKSALARFIHYADPELRPGEEVLVTDTRGVLLGVGKALLSGRGMRAFRRGVAVSIRHYLRQ